MGKRFSLFENISLEKCLHQSLMYNKHYNMAAPSFIYDGFVLGLPYGKSFSYSNIQRNVTFNFMCGERVV